MKKLKVRIIGDNVLELLEDGIKGDTIDLNTLQEVDLSPIQKAIESKKDEVYNKKLQEALKYKEMEYQKTTEELRREHELALAKLNSELQKINESEADKLKIKESEVKSLYEKTIQELNTKILKIQNDCDNKVKEQKHLGEVENDKLKNEISLNQNKLESFEKLKQTEMDSLKEKIEHSFSNEIIILNNKLKTMEMDANTKVLLAETKKEKEVRDEFAKEFEKKNLELENKSKEISDLKDQLSVIRNEKISANIKNIGEDLETHCNNEVEEVMQNGWDNCTWIKDNKVERNEGDTKGSKADFIFRVYADSNKNSEEELTSVCLDMKDENPNSVNKKKNSDYYKALDDNRKKKKCRYAVLVSNLEMNHGTVIPIFKAKEYEDMYVVRPGYLITFLNMIISLSTRFSELVLSKEKEDLELKDKEEFLDEFDSIKKTYLDKPLEQMEKQIDTILKASENIESASQEIKSTCEKIKYSYINGIINKLDRFELKINTQFKKYDK